MTLRTFLRSVGKSLAAAAVALPFVLPAAAQAPTLAMLDSLERGEWELRYRDGQKPRKICVRTGRELIQLRHPKGDCNRIVVEDSPQEITVQYTCRGNGYGRTNIRRETRSLVQVSGQGIAGAKAFEFTAEARRVGACR